ncbi:hypothetical protein MOBT1_001257d, partial [Malassezia obtusa]
MRSQNELCMDLLAFEDMLLSSLASRTHEVHHAQMHAAAERIRSAIVESERLGTLAPTTRHLGARVGQRLQRLSHLLRAEQRETMLMRTTTQNELRELLQSSSLSLEVADAPQDKGDASLNAGRMRAWYLKNIGHPFPSRNTKKAILAETNAEAKDSSQCLQYNQAVLWFINMRRRSGWTTFLRSYAKGDKAMLLEIAWALQNEQGGTHESRQWSAGPKDVDGLGRRPRCAQAGVAAYTLRNLFPEASERFLSELRADWANIIERVKVGAKDRIGDWIHDILRLSESIPSSHSDLSSHPADSAWPF